MGPVYATRLVIYSDTTHPEISLFSNGVKVCYEWLRVVALRYGVEIPEDHLSTFSASNEVLGSQFSAEHLSVDQAMAWRAMGIHPYSDIFSNLQMRFELQAIYSGGGELVITIRLLLGSTYDSIRPIAYRIRPPRLIAQLLEAFPELVSNGNMKATKEVTYLPESEVDDLCHRLVSTNRLIPFIVVSRLEDESVLFPPDTLNKIAADVAGLARVYVLPSFESGYRFSDFLTKKLSCFLGALRIYWPGFALKDSSFQHTLYTAARIEDERLGRIMPEILFDAISAASAIAIGSDAETWRMFRSHAARQQEDISSSLLERLKDASLDLENQKETNRTAEDLFDDMSTQLKSVSDDNANFLDEIVRLEAQVAQLRAYNDTLQHQIRHTDDQNDVINLCSQALECRTLRDVIEFVQTIASEDYLIFLPDAFDSAEHCSYSGDMGTMLKMLLKIQRVSRRYNLGDQLGHKALFEEEGEPNYRANVSDTAQQRHRSDYEKTYHCNGTAQKILLGPHLSFGSGSPTSSVGIYWYVDSANRKYVIGHVGRHLRGKRDT